MNWFVLHKYILKVRSCENSSLVYSTAKLLIIIELKNYRTTSINILINQNVMHYKALDKYIIIKMY